jgi:DNA-binding CsgD family transcriptional regulator
MTQSGFNTKKPSKCMFGRCDWPYSTWHICVDLGTPEPKVQPIRRQSSMFVKTAEHRQNLAAAARERYYEKNAERNAKIKQMYVDGGMSIKEIVREIGLGYHTVRTALLRSGVQMRPKRVNYKRNDKSVHGAFN